MFLIGWLFATTSYTVDATHPAYLSVDVGVGFDRSDLDVWHYDGATWSQFTANDLTYDGHYAEFYRDQFGRLRGGARAGHARPVVGGRGGSGGLDVEEEKEG